MKTASYLFIPFYFFFFANALQAQDWELSKEKDGITVYTRESEGSSVKEFRAITTMDVSMEKLVAVLQDFENYPKWYDHCKSAELIGRNPNGGSVYYTEISMPFPFSNRDVVSQMEVVRRPDKTELNVASKKGVVPEKDGIVRMTISEGSWTLTRLTDGKIRVEHQFKGDPAGNIPSSIVNMFLVSGPINTLTQLREYLRSENR